MESDRMRLQAKESAHLEQEKALRPDLFPECTWADDNETLELLGIHIPNKDGLAQGFIKLLPSDFIVEEMTESGFQTTIGPSSQTFPNELGETVYATLVKCGLSTLEAVDELAKLLGTTKDKIQYAGIKDKNALTSQAISFRGLKKEAVETLSSPHFFLKDIRSGKGVVQKGGLKGNRFTILIRLQADSENPARMNQSLEALKRIKNEGFYNFFYLQRFGTPRLNNYKWGLSILRGDYEKAIRGLISDLGLRELPYFLQKRMEIVALAPDWSAVLEKLQEFALTFPSEIKVVEHLIQKPDDFSGALQKIEDQVVLWVSAVASLLYNRRVSTYVMANLEPPKRLPLFLSPDRNDWLPYQEDLEKAGIFPPPLQNLRPFPKISLLHKEIETKDHANIHATEATSEGIIISFSLVKGEYATTFLSHFVNLLSGKVPEDIKIEIVDTKNILKEESPSDTLEFFKRFNISK